MATYTGADKAVGFLFDMVANIADDYDSSSTYAVDAYVIFSGTLYKCTSAINTPEAFTPAHWQAVLVMDEVAAGGGGGGGTTVIANPAGQATDTLNKLQVGSTIYDVPNGGGGSGHTYSTTEQIVGTWIDGRPVFEITINCKHNYGGLSGDFYPLNYDFSSLDAVQVLDFSGFDTAGRALPYTPPANNPYNQLLYLTSQTINIRTGKWLSISGDVYVTLRYIKSS